MRGALAALALLCWGLVAEAAPQQIRYGLVIGANTGHADETPLLYAEEDAARLARVLTRFASVPEENLILMRGRSAKDVRRVLEGLQARFAADEGAESVLFVYFSGHADATSIHLGRSTLTFRQLKDLIDGTGAQLRVLLVDACRAGALTRLKGAVPAEAFTIKAEDRLDSEGTAIITSAAVGEDAQESDGLRGGIFSHHLINGLLGAADHSGDARVTLNEAYRYAYRETLKTTSRARFVQHPSYAFQMRGRQDLVLTRLMEDDGLGRLALRPSGRYIVLSKDRDEVVELSSTGRTHILLKPGDYLVRRRTEAAVYEGSARITGGAKTTLRSGDLKAIPFGATVRRGGARARAWGVTSAVALSGPPLPATDPSLGGAIGLRLDLQALSLEARLNYSQTEGHNDALRLKHRALGVDLAGLRFFDWGRVSLGLGLRAGADMVRQGFEPQQPEREALVGRLSPIGRLELAATEGISLGVEGGVRVSLDRREGQEDPELNATPEGQLTLHVYLE